MNTNHLNTNRRTRLHPVEQAGMLDSGFRHLFQNPKKIVSKFMDPGMAVLDLGCGTGYFTTEIAKHLNPSGKVVAVDVQQGMLDILIKKIEKQDYGKRIEIHHCQEQHLGLKQRFDFILAFYSFHEMEYLDGIIRELQEISNPGTRILIVEQKFHVSKLMFLSFIKKMESNNFTVIEKPNIFLSRAVLMERK